VVRPARSKRLYDTHEEFHVIRLSAEASQTTVTVTHSCRLFAHADESQHRVASGAVVAGSCGIGRTGPTASTLSTCGEETEVLTRPKDKDIESTGRRPAPNVDHGWLSCVLVGSMLDAKGKEV